MSLGDYLRLLRARRGGVTPWEIESVTELPKGLYRQMEQRYRAVGDDESIRILADYYGTAYEELRWRLDWPRKALSRSLVASLKSKEPITLHLWNGESVSGPVRWWDLGAAALEMPDGELLIVQRHAIERWEPRIEEEPPDEDELSRPEPGQGSRDLSGTPLEEGPVAEAPAEQFVPSEEADNPASSKAADPGSGPAGR